MTPKELSSYIKSEALRLGFAVCGIAKAEAVAPEDSSFTESWVAEGKNGQMSYLERNTEKRNNPKLLVPGCNSIVCVALNYNPKAYDENKLHLSRYAQGEDYHKVVKDKLYMLMRKINEIKPVKGRAFCDSAPLLERYWAQKAGLGWIGKNHQLIIPNAGTYFFLGELLIDAVTEYDNPYIENHCGHCEACIDNCPTLALGRNGFDARRCLAYLTIEHREELPEGIGEKMGKCFYGCDRCQTACPHNRFAKPTETIQFTPKQTLLAMNDKDWTILTREQYDNIFANSAVDYCGYEQLKRNIKAIIKK
ncbi:MAG: tRNA epoxyqueuosine(34) reductase QueG [Bacteroidaceae bacterium]|nr:tRNA epoxyqueuosine(34) reductase QueG [Bacteroidaceae bacterium]